MHPIFDVLPLVSGATSKIRLSHRARSRSIQGQGVAISAGGAAVIINGASAQALWTALERPLRSGVELGDLIANFPDKGQQVVAGILRELDDRRLLVECEDQQEADWAGEVGAFDYYDRNSRRPIASAALTLETRLRISSSTMSRLGDEIFRNLHDAGFVQVQSVAHPQPRDSIPDRTLIIERLFPDGVWRLIVGVVAARGIGFVGPTNVKCEPLLLELLRTQLDARASAQAPTDEAEMLFVSLLASQACLAVLAHVVRESEEGYTGAHSSGDLPTADMTPNFNVSTADLLTEPHSLTILEPVGSAEFLREIAVLPVDTSLPTLPELLDALSPIWDMVFGPVLEPIPGALPQVPLGLARSGVARGGVTIGCGPTSIDAKADAVLHALSLLVGEPDDLLAAVGWSLRSACGSAVATVLDRNQQIDWTPTDLSANDTDSESRRLLASLSLRFGLDVCVRVSSAFDTAVIRTEVWCGAVRLGVAFGTYRTSSVQAALRRALASAQTSSSCEEIEALDARTPQILDELSDWAARTSRIQLFEMPAESGWSGLPIVRAWARLA